MANTPSWTGCVRLRSPLLTMVADVVVSIGKIGVGHAVCYTGRASG